MRFDHGMLRSGASVFVEWLQCWRVGGCARSEMLLASCNLLTQLVLPGPTFCYGFKNPEELE